MNTGQARAWVWNSLLATVALPLAFFYASRWGTVGIAASWIAIHPFVTLPNYRRVLKTIDLSAWDYFRSLWPALQGSAAMAIAVFLLKGVTGESLALPLRLGVEVAGGAAAYGLVLYGLHRPRLIALYQFLKSAKTEGAPGL